MSSVLKGLFINNKKAQDSIFESGMMVFNCLKLSDQYLLDYIEIDAQQRKIPLGYDFYFFNYHPGTMPWMDTAQLKKISGVVITMVLEILPGDPFVLCPDTHFHGYCVLDPTLKSRNPRVFAFPRPLDEPGELPAYTPPAIPVIGSFGFATKGKGFQHVVEAVNKEFDKAVVRINIPFGNFVPNSESYSQFLAKLCIEKAKEGIEVIVTHDYMSKEELIRWCAGNTLNCFLYDRNLPGLAATTDQAIVSGRPLAISKNDTFRHITAYLPPYPEWSLKQSIEQSPGVITKMRADWSPANFARQFESMLQTLLKRHSISKGTAADFEIPLYQKNLWNTLSARYRKYKRLLTWRRINKLLFSKHSPNNEKLI